MIPTISIDFNFFLRWLLMNWSRNSDRYLHDLTPFLFFKLLVRIQCNKSICIILFRHAKESKRKWNVIKMTNQFIWIESIGKKKILKECLRFVKCKLTRTLGETTNYYVSRRHNLVNYTISQMNVYIISCWVRTTEKRFKYALSDGEPSKPDVITHIHIWTKKFEIFHAFSSFFLLFDVWCRFL